MMSFLAQLDAFEQAIRRHERHLVSHAVDTVSEDLKKEADELRRRLHIRPHITTSGDAPPAAPLPMLIWCPECGERHVDSGAFAAKEHHTHACQICGHVWRPAVEKTVGVLFLPGFKDPCAACNGIGHSGAWAYEQCAVCRGKG